jgi:hypothetical protein
MTGVDTTSHGVTTVLSDAWVRRAERLLHDQCWCWGRDVERAEGNLLLEFGFRRVRTPEGRTFAYELDRAGEQVVLAGAGLCYAAAEVADAALLGRYNARPRLLPRAEVDTEQWAQVGASIFQSAGQRDEASPGSRLLLAGAVRWIAGYEAWVREVAGVGYRARCLSSWPSASVSADRMVEEWQALLDELQEGERPDHTPNTNPGIRRDVRN